MSQISVNIYYILGDSECWKYLTKENKAKMSEGLVRVIYN